MEEHCNGFNWYLPLCCFSGRLSPHWLNAELSKGHQLTILKAEALKCLCIPDNMIFHWKLIFKQEYMIHFMTKISLYPPKVTLYQLTILKVKALRCFCQLWICFPLFTLFWKKILCVQITWTYCNWAVNKKRVTLCLQQSSLNVGHYFCKDSAFDIQACIFLTHWCIRCITGILGGVIYGGGGDIPSDLIHPVLLILISLNCASDYHDK